MSGFLTVLGVRTCCCRPSIDAWRALVTTALILVAGACGQSDSPASWSTDVLAAELSLLEAASDGVEPSDVRRLLGDFARRAVGRPIVVSDGIIASVYERGAQWHTRPYFAVDYDRSSYFYLEEVDPDFQSELARHRHWASVSEMTADGQLMFELAVGESLHRQLAAGCHLGFTCELAAVIRGGKSVYCRAIDVGVPRCVTDPAHGGVEADSVQ